MKSGTYGGQGLSAVHDKAPLRPVASSEQESGVNHAANGHKPPATPPSAPQSTDSGRDKPGQRYRTIVADPPWDVKRLESPGAKGFGSGARPLRSVPLPYQTMTVAEIMALPVAGLAEPNAHLYLWTINKYIEGAYAVARAWGFSPSTLLTWAKRPMGLGPGGAYSITTEHVLFSRRGSCPALRRADSTWWLWPRGEHSEKPGAFFDLVQSISPGPYLELFARTQRLGWHTWGNEALCHVALEPQP